jgi:two-component system chemotaxis response regulator CheY
LDKNIRVLIVDDFSTMRRIVKNLLHDLGYVNTTEADDGKSAWTALQAGSFDLVVTDWNMPGMTGLDLLKNIRADARLCALKVLMVTAEAQRDQIIEAAKCGVNGYIIKPFTAVTLKEKLDKIAQRSVGAAA